jgi:hypothetical protein
VNGLINGDPYRIEVTAIDAVGGYGPAADTAPFTVGLPPQFVSGPTANAILGAHYASGFAITGAPHPTVTLASGDLPPGLTLHGDGSLTGDTYYAGSYTFTVRATNLLGSPEATATITVSAQYVPVRADSIGCAGVGGNAYGCLLQLRLSGPLAVNTVFSVGIDGGGFANPSGGDSPQVAYFVGCQVAPLPSPYLANGNAGYNRYDVNISTGGCTAGAVVIFNEAITGAAGATITQPVTVPGLGTGTAIFVLPPAAATPTPARAAAPQHGDHLGDIPGMVRRPQPR